MIISAYNNLSVSVSSNNSYKPNIIIDPGHGGEDGGATANNLTEKDLNLKISKILWDLLKANGYNATITRNEDIAIGTETGNTIRERKVSDMKNRLKIYNSNENNVVISIHQNKFEQKQYHGAQIFYSNNNQDSLVLAERIKSNIVNLIQPENTRECKKATKDIYLLYNSKVPSVIVECGFISNTEESQKLNSNSYQKQMAFSIYLGIVEYLNSVENN